MSRQNAEFMQSAIQVLFETLPCEVDETWFAKATKGLAAAVGADMAMIGRLQDQGNSVQTLGFCENGRIRPNIQYELKGTPCADVLEEGVCVIPDHVVEAYPEDSMLRDLHAEAYAGQPIMDDGRKLLGIVNAIFLTPVRNEEALRGAFVAFAGRLTEKLRDEFESWVDSPTYDT